MSDGPMGNLTANKSPIRTSATLAKILKAEGWTDHLANEVERYIFGSVTSERQQRQSVRIEKAFRDEIVPKLSEGDRLILGRFISLKMAVGFDGGLRTGLGARIQQAGSLPDSDEVRGALGSVIGPSIVEAFAKYHEMVWRTASADPGKE